MLYYVNILYAKIKTFLITILNMRNHVNIIGEGITPY